MRRVRTIIRTPADLGALIRDRRCQRGLDQQTLANEVGVGRQWIVAVEKGKARVEIGLVLRTLDALGVAFAAADRAPGRRDGGIPTVDPDAIVDAARGAKR